MEDIDQRLDIQLALAQEIIGYQTLALKTPTEKRTKSWIKTQLDRIECMWNAFFKEDLALASKSTEKADHGYFKDSVYDEASTKYNISRTLFLNALNPGRDQSSVEADRTLGDIAVVPPPYKNPLPPITLHTFTGKREEWPTYKGVFMALVNDVPSFHPILKLQYLTNMTVKNYYYLINLILSFHVQRSRNAPRPSSTVWSTP